eukprot:NODE_181_length_15774_cov_0.163892.p9 type:complete len:103 gc:universal NODE_181_length_15774_cov_0.163892:5131-5439(+)
MYIFFPSIILNCFHMFNNSKYPFLLFTLINKTNPSSSIIPFTVVRNSIFTILAMTILVFMPLFIIILMPCIPYIPILSPMLIPCMKYMVIPVILCSITESCA